METISEIKIRTIAVRFSSLIFLLLLSDCTLIEGCERTFRLSPGIDQWVPFEVGYAWTFEGDGTENLMTVTDRTREMTRNGYKCPDYTEYLAFYIKSQNGVPNLYIKVESGLSDNRVEIHGFDVPDTSDFSAIYTEGAEDRVSTGGSVTYHEALTVNGKNFNSVLVINCSDCEHLTDLTYANTSAS